MGRTAAVMGGWRKKSLVLVLDCPLVLVLSLLLLFRLDTGTAWRPAVGGGGVRTPPPTAAFRGGGERTFPSFMVLYAATSSDDGTGGGGPKKKDKAMLNFIEQPMRNVVGDYPPPDSVPVEEDENADFVRCIAKAADLRKAEQIVALRVSPISTMCSFLVILSGNSRPQNQAIAAAIMDDVEEQYQLKPQGNGVPEGTADSGWMLLDYGSVMVHIMTPKSRLYYNVEGQWREKGAEELDLSGVLLPNSMPNDASLGNTMDIPQAQDDPFWS